MAEGLKELVEEMRYWQKEYFKTRSQEALRNSKKFEKQVDEWLEAKNSGQQDLFNGSN